MAWELVKGPPVPVPPPLPSSLPPTLASPSLQLLTHPTTCLPLFRCCGHIERGTFPHNLSQPLSALCRASPVFLQKTTFPLCPRIGPPHAHTPFSLLSPGFMASDSKEGKRTTWRAGPQLPGDGNSPSCSSDLKSLHVRA